MYGTTGKLLWVDLSTHTTKTIHMTDRLLIQYLGGRALGARLLYDFLQPGVDALSPDNPFIVLTGMVTGTLVPCSGKYGVFTKSPLTGGFLDSYSSGTISFQLKAAGFDGLILTGACERPTYLYLENGSLSFRNAEHLWGKGAFETEEQILRECNLQAGTIVIGPAGERLVRFASLNSDKYRHAARGGGGAVLGAKKVKGIAVYGTGGTRVYDHKSIRKYYLECVERMDTNLSAAAFRRFGTPRTMNVTNAAGMLPTNNFQKSHCEEAVDSLDAQGCEKQTLHDRACLSCPIGCSKITKATEGKFKDRVIEGPEYETLGILGSNLGITRLSSVIGENHLCDDLGIDTISAGGVIGFVMECFEKGLLKEEEIGVHNPVFGNDDAAVELLQMTALRRGFGDLMANGVRWLADQMKADARRYAIEIKGMEFPAYDPRAGYASCLGYAVSPRGACHRRCWPPALEIVGNRPRFTVEGKAELVAALYNDNTILHSMLLCDFANKSGGITISRCLEYLVAVTGYPYTLEQLQATAERAETIARLVNCAEGFSRKDDTLPERFFREPTPDGPGTGQLFTREKLAYMLDEYYMLRGWDSEGRPKPETVSKLGIAPRGRDNGLYEY